jgi:hypothetical protein
MFGADEPSCAAFFEIDFLFDASFEVEPSEDCSVLPWPGLAFGADESGPEAPEDNGGPAGAAAGTVALSRSEEDTVGSDRNGAPAAARRAESCLPTAPRKALAPSFKLFATPRIEKIKGSWYSIPTICQQNVARNLIQVHTLFLEIPVSTIY